MGEYADVKITNICDTASPKTSLHHEFTHRERRTSCFGKQEGQRSRRICMEGVPTWSTRHQPVTRLAATLGCTLTKTGDLPFQAFKPQVHLHVEAHVGVIIVEATTWKQPKKCRGNIWRQARFSTTVKNDVDENCKMRVAMLRQTGLVQLHNGGQPSRNDFLET
jgi:hypothetical protein